VNDKRDEGERERGGGRKAKQRGEEREREGGGERERGRRGGAKDEGRYIYIYPGRGWRRGMQQLRSG
jgi:hypothetical protein